MLSNADSSPELKALTTPEFVNHLGKLGVELRANGDKLHLTAPAGALDAVLQQELKSRKAALLEYLRDDLESNVERRAPLTYAQQRLWLVERFTPGTAAYNIPQWWVVDGDLDMAALEAAVQRVSERHQALRTRIEVRDGEAVQVVLKQVKTPFEYTDLSGDVQGEEGERLLKRLLFEEGGRPFDLSQAPLIRFHTYRVSEKRYVVAYNLHHIVADQWSLDRLKRDLGALYAEHVIGRAAQLPALTLQYPDVAELERSDATAQLHLQQLEYWRKRLDGVPALLELPFSKTRPAEQSYEGDTFPLSIDVEVTARLRQFAASRRTSLYFVLLTMFYMLLHHYTGQNDLCVGTPVTGRKRREEEDTIGLFINMLPLRCRLDPTHSFEHLLAALSRDVLDDFEHGDLPFQKLVSELHPQRSASYSSLFQVLFALTPKQQDVPDPELEAFLGISKFDLTLQLVERQHSIDAQFEYRTDLFERVDIEQFGRHFLSLVQAVLEAPEQPIGRLNLLTDEDTEALREWNSTAFEHDREASLISGFAEQVKRQPDAIALVCGQSSYTFGELGREVECLTRVLAARGVKRGDIVALCLDRRPELVVSMLAILRAGAAYLPLDPNYPQERLAYMLADSGASVMIAQDTDLSRLLLQSCSGLVVVSPDEEPVESMPAVMLPDGLPGPMDVAYLIYTSGSTGKPKGVVIEHRNAVALIAWAMSYFAPELLRGVLASTSICFDLSVFEIFLPLSVGTTVVLMKDVLELPASPLADRVTLVNTVPSAMNALLQVGLPSRVRTVCLAGEFLPTALVDRVYERGVEKVFDLYGPTETTTYSTCVLRQQGASATIGRPIANTRVYLLNERLIPVAPGAVGEIYIGGEGVARGYLGRDDLTAERFLSLPEIEPDGRLYRTGDLARWRADGSLVYLGRQDHQIKLRGHRIELGEIEAALRDISGVSQLAVVVQKHSAGEMLTAYVAGPEASDEKAREWTRLLKKRLPAFMMPAAIVLLAELPLTPNGKIDRLALSRRSDRATAQPAKQVSEPPRDLLEQWLANIWGLRLRQAYVARNAHFFEELGGHSLVAFEIFAEIEKRLGTAMMLATLFQAPTVELLAAAVRRRGWKKPTTLEMVSTGTAGRVIYAVGRDAVQAADERGEERVMMVLPEWLTKDTDLCAKEIVSLEAGKSPIVLSGFNLKLEQMKRLRSALLREGFTVTMQVP